MNQYENVGAYIANNKKEIFIETTWVKVSGDSTFKKYLDDNGIIAFLSDTKQIYANGNTFGLSTANITEITGQITGLNSLVGEGNEHGKFEWITTSLENDPEHPGEQIEVQTVQEVSVEDVIDKLNALIPTLATYSDLTQLSNAISSEITARTTADTAINTRIDNIAAQHTVVSSGSDTYINVTESGTDQKTYTVTSSFIPASKSEFDSLKAIVDSLNGTGNDSIDAKIAELKSEIIGVFNDDELQSKFDTLQEIVEYLGKTDDGVGVVEDVSQAKQNITQLQSDVTSLDSRVDAAESTLTTLETQVSTLVSASGEKNIIYTNGTGIVIADGDPTQDGHATKIVSVDDSISTKTYSDTGDTTTLSTAKEYVDDRLKWGII